MLGALLRKLSRREAIPPADRGLLIDTAIANRDAEALRELLDGPGIRQDPRIKRWDVFANALEGQDAAALRILESGGTADATWLAELGALARAGGRPAAAAQWWERARAAAPHSSGFAFNIADAWLEAGDCRAAASEAETAMLEMPQDARPRLLAARIAERAGEFGRAVTLYRATLDLQPDCREAWEGMGRAYREDGQFAAAELAFSRAGPDCLLDVGLARFHQRRYDQAAASLRELLAMQPSRADARLVLANALIAAGDFASGWPAYEARLEVPGPVWPSRGAPQWTGAPLAGTLLVDCEQGFGDCILAARFLADAREHVERLVLRCPGPLRALFAASGLADAVIGGEDTCLEAKAHAYLLSLPALLGLASARRAHAYLKVPDARARAWRERLRGSGPLVGLVWSGATDAVQNRFRRFDPRTLAARLAPRARLVSLQLPGPGIEACPGGVADLSPDLGDFAETGAVLLALDALISAETATAHLGGALGVPTLVPLPVTADWRWEIAGVENPWYGSLSVVRQVRFGDWEPVWNALLAALPGGAGARQD